MKRAGNINLIQDKGYPGPIQTYPMNDLLDLALDAHGGWDYWQHLSKLTANASVGGVLWALRGKGILDNLAIEVDCHRQ